MSPAKKCSLTERCSMFNVPQVQNFKSKPSPRPSLVQRTFAELLLCLWQPVLQRRATPVRAPGIGFCRASGPRQEPGQVGGGAVQDVDRGAGDAKSSKQAMVSEDIFNISCLCALHMCEFVRYIVQALEMPSLQGIFHS